MKEKPFNSKSYIADIDIAGKGYNATFYDFPGCVSAGDTLTETIQNAKIALQCHIDGMLEDGEKIPIQTPLETLIKKDKAHLRILIEVNTKKLKKKRIDITLDENLIRMIDTVSHNRSEFVSEAVNSYIKEKLD